MAMRFVFNAVIDHQLERHGWSLRQLTKEAGLAPDTINKILNKPGHKVRVDTLEKIAEALGIEPTDFWTEEK